MTMTVINPWRVIKDIFTNDSRHRLEKAFDKLDEVIIEIMKHETNGRAPILQHNSDDNITDSCRSVQKKNGRIKT